MVHDNRAFSEVLDRLREAGLRPTRQRMALCKLLFEKGDCHVSAENLHAEAKSAGIKVSLATVYNTLHQFTDVGLLRQVVVDNSRSYFDTNVTDHHHFFVEADGHLVDIPAEAIDIGKLPKTPPGTNVDRVDVIVRVSPSRRK